MHFDSGFFGIIILILDVWAIISTIHSDRTVGIKVLWTVVVIVLPIIGFIIWLIAGPKAKETEKK